MSLMSFVVSARKYRPNHFNEVVGQQHVSSTLKNALKSDHVAHAFLFTGPRGVGKTTCARILGKVLNCENRTPDFEACDTCPSCTAFTNNASFNIVELDAASNNSVEHIRALNEQVRFAPQEGKYKIFIIDEVHMLTAHAFNAFLKTLEEPPSYAKFILATTEKHKILPTILSRCQIFDFNRIGVQDIINHLQHVCEKEGITAEPEALRLLGQKADGALRDALSLFDRMVSFTGDNLTYAAVRESLNILDYETYFEFMDHILIGNHAGSLMLFDRVLRDGFEASIVLGGLMQHVRDLLVCQIPATVSLLEVGESAQQRYAEQALQSPRHLLLSALDLLNIASIEYRMATNKRLHVEAALIKLCYLTQMYEGGLAATPTTEKKKVVESKQVVEEPAPKLNTPEASTKIPDVPKATQEIEQAPAQQQAPIASSSGLLSKRSILDDDEDDETLPMTSSTADVQSIDDSTLREAISFVAASHMSTTQQERLGSIDLDYKDGILEVKTVDQSIKNVFDNYNFRSDLCKQLSLKALKINVAIDKQKVAAKAKEAAANRPPSKSEHLNEMINQQPYIETLIKEFDLRLDE